jgi:hypothetical protein
MQRKGRMPTRRPKNEAEGKFYDLAIKHGWAITKRGWPDFFLWQDGKIAVVEIKPSRTRRLKADQLEVLAALARHGVPAFRWSPDGGFERIEPTHVLGGRGVAVNVGTTETTELQLETSLWDEGSGEKPLSAAALEAAPSLPSRSETSRATDRVWTAYVTVMQPRRTAAGEEERAFITKALKVASVEELVVCIRSCEASDYHMKRGKHANRPGGKYNSIGKILHPRPRFGETQRSRIDWWLDKEKSSGVAGFPSADTAIVQQHQLEVQRGHQTDDPDVVRKAEVAKAWLAEHGIETIQRESDGFPIFRRRDEP